MMNVDEEFHNGYSLKEVSQPQTDLETLENIVPFEKEVYYYLTEHKSEGINGLQKALNLDKNVIFNALHSLKQKSLVNKVNGLYTIQELNHS
jgi:predicted transcriptional regulator